LNTGRNFIGEWEWPIYGVATVNKDASAMLSKLSYEVNKGKRSGVLPEVVYPQYVVYHPELGQKAT